MGRGFAAQSEVAVAGNETGSEVPLPDPVDDDPGGEGVGGVCDPAGQFEVSASVPCSLGGESYPPEDFREFPWDLGTGTVGLAFHLDAGIDGGTILNGVGDGDGW